MKSRLFLTFALLVTGAVASESPFASPAVISQALQRTAADLAQEVKAIATAANFSAADREKMVMDAIKLTTATAIEGTNAPAEVLRIALHLGCVVAPVTPQYASALVDYIAAIPAVATIPEVRPQIEKAIQEAIAAARPTDPEFSGQRGENNVSPSR